MRATLDFHGFSCGSTTVRHCLPSRWSSSEMLQGVGREGHYMRFFGLETSGSVWKASLSCGGVELLGLKVIVLDAPLHLGSSPLLCLLFHSMERMYSLNPWWAYRLPALVFFYIGIDGVLAAAYNKSFSCPCCGFVGGLVPGVSVLGPMFRGWCVWGAIRRGSGFSSWTRGSDLDCAIYGFDKGS
ncbi:hypothetical protein Bca4012_050071 [Brassica carinata]